MLSNESSTNDVKAATTGDHFEASFVSRVEICEQDIDVNELYAWAVQDVSGAVVLFSGTVRNHSDGRENVTKLEFEAYNDAALTSFRAIIDQMRVRWPQIASAAIVHRVGAVDVGQSSVVVVVSSPHRSEAFDACEFGIDSLKETSPIWKFEHWDGQAQWGVDSRPITQLENSFSAKVGSL